jgi:hypothetical protein
MKVRKEGKRRRIIKESKKIKVGQKKNSILITNELHIFKIEKQLVLSVFTISVERVNL